MVARLGYVIYWLCSGIALLWLAWFALAMAAAAFGGVSNWTIFLNPFHSWRNGFEPTATQLALIALGTWLVGRAARYVLSGK